METTNRNSGITGQAGSALPGAGRAVFGQGSASAMSMKWSALHDASAAVATLAGVTVDPMPAEIRNFPAVMRDCGGWRRELAEQGIDDLSAVMEPGLSALLAACARGVSTSAAAMALWQEFQVARDALMALTPPPEVSPARRIT
jgi:hypothetical protein